MRILRPWLPPAAPAQQTEAGSTRWGTAKQRFQNLTHGPVAMALSDLGTAHGAHGRLAAAQHTQAAWATQVDAEPSVTGALPTRQRQRIEQKMADLVRAATATHDPKRTAAPSLFGRALRDDAACEAALAQRFRGPSAELVAMLMALPDDPALPADGRHAHRLRLGSALAKASAGNVHLGTAVLTHWLQPDDAAGTPQHRILAAQIERELAATHTGMAALCHLRGLSQHSPEQKEGLQEALRICHWLTGQVGGIPQGASGTLQDFIHHANAQTHIHQNIGSPQDAPLQLAHKALLYAHAKSQGQADVAQAHLPAYVAWCNGFETSGQGTRFDAMLGRLGKLWNYYQRAVSHGPRTAWNLTRDVGRGIASLFGKGKPLMEGLVGMGTMGADQGVNQAEIGLFRQQLRQSIALLRAPLAQRAQTLLNRLRTSDETRELMALHSRIGLLDLWSEKGVRHLRPELDEVMPYITRLAPHLPLDTRALATLLHKGSLRGPQTFKLKDLEAWAQEVLSPSIALKGQSGLRLRERQASLEAIAAPNRTPSEQADLDFVHLIHCIHETRHTARGRALARADRTHLFQLEDLVNLALRRPPRETATPAHIENTLRGLAKGDNLKSSRFVNQWGLNNDIAVWAPSIAAIAPAYFGPDVGGRVLQTSMMDAGTTKVGFVFKFGKQAPAVNGNLGVFGGARWGVGPTASAGGSTSINGIVQHSIRPGEVVSRLRGRSSKPAGQVLTLMAPREQDGANYLEEAQRLTEQVLQLCQRPRKPDPSELWRDWVTALGDNRRWSVGLSDEKQDQRGYRIKLNAGVNFGPTSRKVGPALVAQLDDHVSRHAALPKSGRYRITQHTWTHRIVGQLGVGLSTQLPFMIQTDQGVIPAKPLPLASLSKTSTLRNDSVSVHLTHELGALRPELCYQDRWFASATELAEYVNLHHAEWEACAQFTSHDGHALRGAPAVSQFLKESQQLAGEFVYYERLKLRPEAAARVNLLQDEATALHSMTEQSTGRPDPLKEDLQRIEHDIQHLLTDRASWMCRNLYVAEIKSDHSNAGIPVGLELMSAQSETVTAKVLKLTATH